MDDRVKNLEDQGIPVGEVFSNIYAPIMQAVRKYKTINKLSLNHHISLIKIYSLHDAGFDVLNAAVRLGEYDLCGALKADNISVIKGSPPDDAIVFKDIAVEVFE